MKTEFDLPPIANEDSVIPLLDELRAGLLDPKEEFNDRYIRIRAILRRHPLLKSSLPEFLYSCPGIAELVAWKEQQTDKSFEWLSYVGNTIARIGEVTCSGASLENYIPKQVLGQGGFGVVWLVDHKVTERKFAVKFFHPSFHEGGGEILARFFQEASMLYDLNHPSIIQVRDVGLYQERPFIVMDYFGGQTLAKAIQLHGAMPVLKAQQLFLQVSQGIEYAHSKGVIHRDLTPNNILVAPPNQC